MESASAGSTFLLIPVDFFQCYAYNIFRNWVGKYISFLPYISVMLVCMGLDSLEGRRFGDV